MNKRGMSAIIATVLIVLISVVAIGVIWIGIIPMINEDINFDKSVRLDIVTTDGYTFYDEDNHLVSVQIRQVGGENVDKIKLIIEFGGDSYDYIDVSPGVGQTKVYLYNVSHYGLVPSSVKVAPIFNMNGKDVEGDINSIVSFIDGVVDPEDYDDLKDFLYDGCDDDEEEDCGSGNCIGVRTCNDGVWADCVPEVVEDEVCSDDLDNDCDGNVDCNDIDCFGGVDCSDLGIVVLWSKTFGGSGHDAAYSVQEADGGYIIAGSERSSEGHDNLWLVKTDSDGNEVWNKIFDGGLGGSAYSVQEADGGYVVAGDYQWGPSDSNAFLIKTDSDGNEVWSEAFSLGDGINTAYSVQQTSDGGYIVAGQSGDLDAFLIKTSSGGEEQWSQVFDNGGADSAYSVQQIDDGYIFAGQSTRNFWLVKTDSDGNEVWNKTFTRSINDIANSVQQTSDGGYIIAGHSLLRFGLPTVYEFWLLKTFPDGSEDWSKSFGEWGSGAKSARQTSDGGYIVAGQSINSDALLVKLSFEGDQQWNKTFGGSGVDFINSVEQLTPSTYIASGGYQNSDGNNDFWLVKIEDTFV